MVNIDNYRIGSDLVYVNTVDNCPFSKFKSVCSVKKSFIHPQFILNTAHKAINLLYPVFSIAINQIFTEPKSKFICYKKGIN